jgi:hypothetical protein
MIISIIISAYLCIGIALVFFGPLANCIKDEKQLIENRHLIDIDTQKPVSSWEKISFLVALSIGVILFWSVFFLDDWRLKIQEANNEEGSNDSNKMPYLAIFDETCCLDPRLYFFKMGGVGVIECQSCYFMEKVISFTHGAENHSGCQCMSCGKFKNLTNAPLNIESMELTCECGGILSDQKPVFCPRCKQYKMKYVMSYIT